MRASYLLMSVVVLLGASPAFAGLVISIDTTPADISFVENISVAQTGSLDVYITKDTSSYSVASYNARVDLGASGITLTGDGVSSGDHPALFPTTPILGFGSNTVLLRAADNLASGQAAVANGAGLFSIKFTIPAGVSGDFPLTLNPSETFLFDGSANAVAIDSLNGATIHVASVPEPASILMLGGAACCFLLRRGVRRPI